MAVALNNGFNWKKIEIEHELGYAKDIYWSMDAS